MGPLTAGEQRCQDHDQKPTVYIHKNIFKPKKWDQLQRGSRSEPDRVGNMKQDDTAILYRTFININDLN